MAIDRISGSGSLGRPDNLDQPKEPAKRAGAGEAREAAGDRVELSAAAKQARELSAAARSAPDIRQERVDALRRSLADNGYFVEARALARKILEFEDELGR